jgi:putative tricarboxylic transport membrane protein
MSGVKKSGIHRWCARLAWLLAGLALPQAASAQAWVPQRHVEVTVPNAQGSSLDITARVIQKLWHDLKLVPVTSALVNRQGGEQAIAYTYLRQRTADPHYLSFANPALLSNHIFGRMAFTYTDFTPIAFLMSDDYIFAVRADHPLKSGKEMVDALKARPDSLSFGMGNLTHRIAIGMVLQSANVDIKQVKMVVLNAGTQAASAMGGHVDIAVSPLGQMLPHLESGKMRVLGVSAPKRKPGVLANVPTWPELGYKSGTYETWRAMIAPKDITPAQVAYWEDVLRKVVQSEDFKKAAEKHQWDVDFKGAADTRKHMDEEYAATKRVMTYLGLIQ